MAKDSQDIKTQFELTQYIIETNTKDKSLSKIDKLVLICLSNYMQRDKYGIFSGFPSQTTLADVTGMNRNTVGNSLEKIEKLGYLHSETRFDNSKVYTWLGFENKTIESINFIKASKDKADRKKEFDRKRGETLGRNKAEYKRLFKFAETLKGNGYLEDCQRQLDKLEVVKEAMKHNVYFKEYQPYKDLCSLNIQQQAVTIEYCESCGNVLDENFCDNPDCDYLPF